MREWRLRTAQRSFYRPANCASESVRGTRPIVARKKIAIGVSIGALDFMSRESKSFPPARMERQSRKSHPWKSNANRTPGTIAQTTDSGWNAKGKPLRAFIGWPGSIPGRCHRGHFHNRDRISISGASEKQFFCMATSIRDAEISSGQPGTRTALLAS